MGERGWEARPCSSHDCVWGHPGGMGTNGGCRHLKATEREMRRIVQHMGTALTTERERAERAEAERDRLAAENAALMRVLAYKQGAHSPAEPATRTALAAMELARAMSRVHTLNALLPASPTDAQWGEVERADEDVDRLLHAYLRTLTPPTEED